MFEHTITMRIVSIMLSLSMVLSTIGNGTAGFDCAVKAADAQGYGASETTSYNAADHVKNLTNRDAAGNVISEYAYTYYVSGSPATKTDASGTTVYTYDGQNRLKTATYSDGTKDVYTFDDILKADTIVSILVKSSFNGLAVIVFLWRFQHFIWANNQVQIERQVNPVAFE